MGRSTYIVAYLCIILVTIYRITAWHGMHQHNAVSHISRHIALSKQRDCRRDKNSIADISLKNKFMNLAAVCFFATFSPSISGHVPAAAASMISISTSIPISRNGVEQLKLIEGDKSHPFQFSVPEDLVVSPKLVKTHQYEVFLKSSQTKGFNAGITVDPVRIESVLQFSSPAQLADRVLQVEKDKEGFLNGRVIDSLQVSVSSISDEKAVYPAYELDYEVETSRGKNHFLVRAAIVDKKLYVLTTQCSTSSFDLLEEQMRKILLSLRI